MKVFLALLASLIVTLTAASQPYDLKLNLQKGQRFTQSMTMNVDMTQSIAGQDVAIRSAMQFEFDQYVKSITAKGDFVIESRYTHIVLDVDAMGQKMFYDSQAKDSSGNDMTRTYAAMFDQLLGKNFSVVLSPKGKVLEIKGLKELMTAVKKSTSDPIAQKLIEAFDEKKMISNYESSYHIFPDKPVQPGESWSQKNAVESLVPVDISASYTLKEVNNGIAKIAATGDFSMKNDEIEANGIKMKTNLSGSYDGIYLTDINTGMTQSATISMPLRGTMEVMGMEFPVTVNTTMQNTTTMVVK
jgi:hypothetical protein